ncbi:SubName: Full=Uncharacterized protein {ECO:0000313/EMBL:CCA67660.1} [Serendipita indica DSM 11827]|nr:SubName: Full=Uncharacterized protein {ECO:0000313/EMBL:CCA67660.1} [Serendipita indica DSM 11827]
MAAAFKAKGNEFFKAGNYAAAVGEYTSAMLADPKDATFPLNRAAAYLKLNKFQDAERDCGRALTIEPKNVKALFRRGQARAGLGNYSTALQDIDQVLKLEPANETAKQEQKRIQALLDDEKQARISEEDTHCFQRRRVPIEIVEDEEAPTVDGTSTQPSSVNKDAPIIEIISEGVSKESSNPPKSFQQAKQERSSRVKAVGGGIFKRDGTHSASIFEPKDVTSKPSGNTPPEVESPIVTPSPAPQEPPRNAFEFSIQWNSAVDDKAKWKILKSVAPQTLPTLFRTSLEPQLLGGILQILLYGSANGGEKRDITQYLTYLGQIPRFASLALFLSQSEKDAARKIISWVGESVGWKV